MMLSQSRRGRRRGAVVVWFAVLAPTLLGMVAFSVDIGWIVLVQNELQVAADAGAMAGAGALPGGQPAARATAKTFAQKNSAGATGDAVAVDDADVLLGNWDPAARAFAVNEAGPNAVQVTTRKSLDLFFARIIGMRTIDLAATAVATRNPRDIAFVIDLSGSMNNDTEIWATAPINAAFKGYPTVGTDLMQAVYDDFGFGPYPGTVKYAGQVAGTTPAIPASAYTPNPSGQSPAYAHLTNAFLLNNSSVAAPYRVTGSDSAAAKKTKAYKWLIDAQLKAQMPNARPPLDSSQAASLSYWSVYLDYVLNPTTTIPSQSSYDITSGANPYTDAWPGLSSAAVNPFRNQVGYQSYVQFLMDFGRNGKTVLGVDTPLSAQSPNCPWRADTDPTSPGYGLSFPPREQPTHAARMAIMAGVNKIKDHNPAVAKVAQDHVCVITFDTSAGTVVKYALAADSCDYDAARASVRDLQAVSDWEYSTASEGGLIAARDHLDPAKNKGARPYSTKVLIFLSDGIPNVKQSSAAAIDAFVGKNTKGEWFGGGSFQYERNAAMMQVMQMKSIGWKTHVVGLGLGADLTLMDRMARASGTAIKNPLDPDGPKVSRYADGNPADYQARLTAIFDEIARTPNVQLVR
jgi:Flp pilus assembly protein TadG